MIIKQIISIFYTEKMRLSFDTAFTELYPPHNFIKQAGEL